MSDKPPNEGDRSGNLSMPLFADNEKARQQLSQAASSLFPVPQMFPGGLSPLTLHQSFAAVAFQQIVNSAQPRPSLFTGAPSFFDVKGTAHPFPGLPAFPTIQSSGSAGPSVFSPPPIMKPSPGVANAPQQQQQRSHIGPSASPGLSGRQPPQGHSVPSSSTPTVIVKQQQTIIGSGGAMGSGSQQSVKVSSGSGHRSHSHHHSSDSKSRVQASDMPPVVIASPVVTSSASGGVRLLASSPFQPMQPPSAPGLAGYPSSTQPSGQPRLVPIQQQQQQQQHPGDVPKITSTAASSVNRPSVVQSSGSNAAMRHSSSQHQHTGMSPVIPVVKISPAGSDQAIPLTSKLPRGDGRVNESQQPLFHPSSGSGIFYATQSTMVNPSSSSGGAQMKTFPVQPAPSRVPWSPLIHAGFPHSRPAVPVGGNGQPVMTETDLSGGQHGVSSRPGILRKRPAGEGGNVSSSQSSMTGQSPRRSLTRLPPPIGGGPSILPTSSSIPQMPASIYMPPSASGQHHAINQNLPTPSNTAGHAVGTSTSAGGDQPPSASHTFAPPGILSRDASTSSASSQVGVKSEAVDSGSEPPARKKPRKQQLLPRSGPDNLMVSFDPLSTISQLPTVPTSSTSSSHHRQHKHGVSVQNAGTNSGNSSVSSHSATTAANAVVKEEAEASSTPEPEVTEDDRKMSQLIAGEIQEFTDSEGVRWFSLRNGESSSKNNKHTSKCQQSPAPKLSDFYRCTWRVRNNHFERHSDVRAKDERCPALSEFCVAARSHIAREAAGWRLVQFLTLLDDQMAVEHKTLDRVNEIIEDCRGIDAGLSKMGLSLSNSSGSNKDNFPEGHSASTSTPLNGGPAKRGRGGAHRLSGGASAARQSARTRQQHQQQNSSSSYPPVNVPFEYTQLPDMFTELNRRLKAVSNCIQSLYTAHVPVAHQVLDRYAPLKPLKARSSSSTSHSSSSSSNQTSSASSTPLVGGESVPLSPALSTKDLKETIEPTPQHDQATEDCLMAAVESVSEKYVDEDKQRLSSVATMETSPVASPPTHEEQSVPKREPSISMESSTFVS